MSLLSSIVHLYFKSYKKQLLLNSCNSIACQQKTFSELISKGRRTAFGKEHSFADIRSYEQYRQAVPVRSYENFLPYIQRIFSKEPDVLWQGLPLYFGKTSGTTGAPKYLPITKEFISSTHNAAKYMLANLVLQLNNAELSGKILHISDPHVFEKINGFLCGAISAIKSHQIPAWAKRFSLPDDAMNSIANPAQRLCQTINAIAGADIRMAVGLPVWLVNFLCEFERQTGKKFRENFPNFKALFVTGMNYEPYQKILETHLGNHFFLMENYTATEGNFAFQDRLNERGMQLICNQGIFYEFIRLTESDSESATRYSLREVKCGEKYLIAVSTNGGLWAYRMTDLVEFVSLDPYRLIVCGRVNDIFSPFGEHILPAEVEHAIANACEQTGNTIKDFIVSAYVNSEGRPRHKWHIEFIKDMHEEANFTAVLNETLCSINTNYNDLIINRTILPPLIILVRKDFFKDFYKEEYRHHSTQTKVSRFKTDTDWEYKPGELNNQLQT